MLIQEITAALKILSLLSEWDIMCVAKTVVKQQLNIAERAGCIPLDWHSLFK